MYFTLTSTDGEFLASVVISVAIGWRYQQGVELDLHWSTVTGVDCHIHSQLTVIHVVFTTVTKLEISSHVH